MGTGGLDATGCCDIPAAGVAHIIGPSPRAWGKQTVCQPWSATVRTIPTGVGKTEFLIFAIPMATDHPHGRGENGCATNGVKSDSGPSPRAWGKLDPSDLLAATRRTIPTGVGKTLAGENVYSHKPDHPHGRGENAIGNSSCHSPTGPSPRAWGKLLILISVIALLRTIPTGVGKTKLRSRNLTHNADHPHGRGENLCSCRASRYLHGPSPRAWGKLIPHRRLHLLNRTIPTGVGKTRSPGSGQRCTPDHPHGRGENRAIPSSIACSHGPSPRAWGKLVHFQVRPDSDRTIPTGVGKTANGHKAHDVIKDHPHGRGENLKAGRKRQPLRGPSPRAWGKL